MPRKPFEKQAGYMFHNRSENYLLNQNVKHCKIGSNEGDRYDECWSELGFYPRNPDMKPLLKNGGKP